MAYVFLTVELAFKLKKPVSFGYFDHRSLAARASSCTEELRLNRALADDVYLGMDPLMLKKTGIGGDGATVDWLVQMRRLPAERMLDMLIGTQKASPSQAEVAAVVARLARFYRQQPSSPPPAGLYLAHLQRQQ